MTANYRLLCLLATLALALFSGCVTDSPERQSAFGTLARWEDQRFAQEDSLLSMIKGDDAHVRLQALRTAGLIGQRNVVPAMIAALDDPSETVGRQAAFSLGLMGDSAAVPALEAILTVPRSRLHLAAVRALAHLDHQGRGLLTAATFDDPLVSAAAWDGLRNIADQADSSLLAAAITDGLTTPRSDVLWRVLRCAERLPAAELVPHLTPHVRSNIAQVRVHAFRALAKQNSASALNTVLLGHLQPPPTQDRHQRTLVATCRALGTLGAHAFYPNSTISDDNRHLLTEALIEAAGSENPHLATTALAAMREISKDFDLPPEAAHQESLLPVWRIRLGRASFAHLDHENSVVRSEAYRSWSALRGSGSETELHRRLNATTDTTDLEGILYALGRQGENPVQILSAYCSGQTPIVRVRVAALEALHHLAGRPENSADRSIILNKLTQAAADTDFVVAATAIGYLDIFPERTSLIALNEAWDTAYPEGEAEVKRAILTVFSGYGEKINQLKRTDLPENMPDRLITICGNNLREAFDSPDLRIRLEARETALITELLPSALIPTEGSLRATLPSFRRSPNQPPVHLAFSAPEVLCTTDQGTFTIKLDGEIAPNTCAMFMGLISRGYYDNLIFHRVVPDFVVQGGDPRGDGWGGPGYTIRSEWSRARYKRAFVGIAHDGKDTGGSQFFITLSEQPHLNGRYTIFGEVKEGMRIVDKIEAGDHFKLEILP